MKVKELIAKLSKLDQDKTIHSKDSEYGLCGITLIRSRDGEYAILSDCYADDYEIKDEEGICT